MLADRYELHALLGAGGMAEVYEATAHGAHGFVRRVAVKRMLSESTSDPDGVRLFLDEARIASRLHHASIVAVLDCGVVDDAPFQVLEFVDGWDAAALMRRVKALGRSVPLDVALYITTEVAHALAHAHEATNERGAPLGIVHRDVKPSNVLVSRGGDVKLGDFGIALASERASRTTGFVARGTPAYMPPEQLRGVGVDHRADIFSLGCTLHALVTGASPLTEESARAALLSGARLPLASTLPPGILAIVARAVSVDPHARFPSARAMAHELGSELSRLLRTDPRSRMRQWLDELDAPPRAVKKVPPSVLVSSMQPSRTTGSRLAATLTETDRVFTSHTAPMNGPSLPAAYAATLPAAQASAPPPAWSASGVPAPPAPSGLQLPLPPHAPGGGKNGLVFVIALIVPITLALIAGAGVVAGHWLSRGAAGDAGPALAPPADGAATVGGSTGPSAGSAATSAGSAATSTAKPPPVAGKAQGETGAAELAGTGPPVSDGCICNAEHEEGISGVCHPQLARAPVCQCIVPSGPNLCWVAFSKDGSGGNSLCPERSRPMPSSAREGDPCVGFPMVVSTVKDAEGKSISRTSTEAARSGKLDVCDRCPGAGRVYPRTPGAPCVGISPNGARVRGKVDCR